MIKLDESLFFTHKRFVEINLDIKRAKPFSKPKGLLDFYCQMVHTPKCINDTFIFVTKIIEEKSQKNKCYFSHACT